MLAYLLQRIGATLPEAEASAEEDAAKGVAPSPGLALVKATLDAHAERNLDLEYLAGLADCSRFHLVRAFRLAYRETPHRYQIAPIRGSSFRTATYINSASKQFSRSPSDDEFVYSPSRASRPRRRNL